MTIAIPLTQGKIAQVDDVDADLAALRWCAHKNRKVYYAVRSTWRPRRTELLHRVIANRMGIFGTVDHVNRDGLDCTRQNLRAATRSQNASNSCRPASNKSGVKGVSWDAKSCKWHARIKVDGTSHHLGFFSDLGMARAAVEAARRQVHGAFARDE